MNVHSIIIMFLILNLYAESLNHLVIISLFLENLITKSINYFHFQSKILNFIKVSHFQLIIVILTETHVSLIYLSHQITSIITQELINTLRKMVEFILLKFLLVIYFTMPYF